LDLSETQRNEVLRLFMQRQRALAAYVYTLCEDWEVVEEAIQETALFLCNRWEDFELGTDFNAWARSVARFRTLEVLRKRQRGRMVSLEIPQVSAAIPDEDWDRQAERDAEYKDALTHCLRSLPDKHRNMVEMRYMQRFECSKIADRLRTSIESVYMALSRIRRRLRDCISQKLAEERN